ncbi:hypothetical protein DL96DRAFT_1821209 [Flagelloscypha sp. PMI_526]|nr:hypothetical protein DL96DRAFT_1821209 [Flagelloscypha sp. PMI_526]
MPTIAVPLPPELEREIFEWAAYSGTHDEIRAFVLVVKRVHEWITPILNKTIIIRGWSPQIRIQTLNDNARRSPQFFALTTHLILRADSFKGYFPSLAPLLLHTPNLQVLDLRATSIKCIIPSDTFHIAFTRPLRHFAPNPAWASELRVYNFGNPEIDFIARRTLTHFQLSISPKTDVLSLRTLLQLEQLKSLLVTPVRGLEWPDFHVDRSPVARQVFSFLIGLKVVDKIMLGGAGSAVLLSHLVVDGHLNPGDYMEKIDADESWVEKNVNYERLVEVYGADPP